jgi:hypothetical protein
MSDNSSNPLIVSLPRHRFERTTKDSEPILFQEITSQDQQQQQHEGQCMVCQENMSRYTCPQCQILYCSVVCYRNHTSNCTEAFYRTRAESILKLEASEQQDETSKILRRQYEDSLIEETNEEELYELLLALENGETTQKELLSIMSPTTRATFEKDIQSESLQKMVLDSWHPWWRREFVRSCDKLDEANDETHVLKTLDDRLLKISKFESLYKRGVTPPLLLYNLIDIVYATCWTLRLYHGVQNALLVKVDAAATLLEASSVLSKDARYENLPTILGKCAAASTSQYKKGCNSHWTILSIDCSLILTSHRLVGRALLEAIDILKAAYKGLKKDNKRKNTSSQNQISELRKGRKKMEYFLSWSLHQSSRDFFGSELEIAIQEWVQHWKAISDPKEDSSIKALEFPPSEPLSRHSRAPSSLPPLLMTAIETKSKS